MNQRMLVAVCAFAVTVSAVGIAQTSEVKEKAPMYSYIGNWAIPRAGWSDMAKNTAEDKLWPRHWPRELL